MCYSCLWNVFILILVWIDLCLRAPVSHFVSLATSSTEKFFQFPRMNFVRNSYPACVAFLSTLSLPMPWSSWSSSSPSSSSSRWGWAASWLIFNFNSPGIHVLQRTYVQYGNDLWILHHITTLHKKKRVGKISHSNPVRFLYEKDQTRVKAYPKVEILYRA